MKSAFLESVGFALALMTGIAGGVHAADGRLEAPRIDFAGAPATPDARIVANWVAENADNQRLPFVIVDKKNAQAFVFGAGGQLKGVTPVLLGLAVGDGGLTDMSGREVSSLRAAERTTPAGRFVAEPGHNLQGEEIVWVDYAAKIAIHRLRPAPQRERRAQRLASATVDDNRISLGCIVVPVAFYENVVRPVLGNSRSVVYVLPETRSLQGMLGVLHAASVN